MSDAEVEAATTDTDALPVKAAAAALGIHEKRLRRLLNRPEYRDRVRTGTRETRTGTRPATLLPSPLLEDIRARISLTEAEESNGDNLDGDGDTDTAGTKTRTGTGTGTRSGGARSLTVNQVSAVYERMIAEKDARLADKDREIERLANVVSELTRAMREDRHLRALQASEPATDAVVQDTPQNRSDSPETLETAADGRPEGTEQEQAEGRRGWWARLWGRG